MKHLTTFIAVLFLLAAVCCSKEKRMEKKLTKKGGVWQIDQMTWKTVVQDTSGQTIKSGTETNAGTFTFDDNGTLAYDYTFDGSHKTGVFQYTVSGENFTVVAINQSVLSISQTVVAYSGSKTDQRKIEMTGTETTQNTGGQTIFTATFYMSR